MIERLPSAGPARRFTPDRIAGLDEPVRRYFKHAISAGAALPDGVRMTMRGRIKVGVWLPLTAVQTVDGHSLRPLHALRRRGLRHGPLSRDARGD